MKRYRSDDNDGVALNYHHPFSANRVSLSMKKIEVDRENVLTTRSTDTPENSSPVRHPDHDPDFKGTVSLTLCQCQPSKVKHQKR